MIMYIVHHYHAEIVVIDFVTNDRVISIDKHKELGGCDNGYYITMCKNSEIV